MKIHKMLLQFQQYHSDTLISIKSKEAKMACNIILISDSIIGLCLWTIFSMDRLELGVTEVERWHLLILEIQVSRFQHRNSERLET